MNVNKFTQKSIESIQECDKIAMEYGNQAIDQEHFLQTTNIFRDSLSEELHVHHQLLNQQSHQKLLSSTL